MIRSGNEDNFAVEADAQRGLFVVADGMGGHAAGEVASEMAVQIVLRELIEIRDLETNGVDKRLTDEEAIGQEFDLGGL
jgi:protein phosphatase